MTNRLEKLTRITVIPGSPGMPGTPGQAYQPARTYTVTETVCSLVPAETVRVAVPPNPYEIGSDATRYIDMPVAMPAGSGAAPLYTRVCETFSRKVTEPAKPYIPPRNPIPAKPEQRIHDFNLGWNAGAVSVATGFAAIVYQFQVSPGAAGVISGLSAPVHPEIAGFAEIEFAWHVTGGHARVVESGVAKTDYVAIAPATVLEVARVGNCIVYRLDGVDQYVSATTRDGPLWADAGLYSGGDAIVDAAFVDTATAYGEGTLQPLRGSAAGGFTAFCDGLLAPLRGEASGRVLAGSAGSLRALEGLSGDSLDYAQSRGLLSPLTGHAEAGLPQADTAYSQGVLPPLLGAAHGREAVYGLGAGSLLALTGLAADRPYGEAKGVLWPLAGIAFNAIDPALLALHFFGHGRFPAFTGYGRIEDLNGQGRGAFPSFTSSVRFGWIGTGAFPRMESRGTMSAVEIFTGRGSFPPFQVHPGFRGQGAFPRFAAAGLWSAPDDAAFRAWLVNLALGETTAVPAYRFLRVIRLGAVVYGVKADGLYRLDSGSDAGGTALDARVRTVANVLASEGYKRVPSLYVDSPGTNLDILPQVDTVTAGTYRTDIQRTGRQRVKLARGPKGLRWAFEFRNVGGNTFRLAQVEFLTEYLNRKV